MTICIVGLGLIGGSLALALKEAGFASKIIGVDNNPSHVKEALNLGLITDSMSLEDAVSKSNFTLLAIPVNAAKNLIVRILDDVPNNGVVMDMGSTKLAIANSAKSHPKRKHFVAAHPIAGTENTGPSAAFNSLFTNKMVIICDQELSSQNALDESIELFNALKMQITYMSSAEHDKHIAYVSHLSHVSSFALGLTVLAIEKDEKNIFNMAGSGFESTVRLAKSSPQMWNPILLENSENILEALDAYINQLISFKELIVNKNGAQLTQLMEQANSIRKILKK